MTASATLASPYASLDDTVGRLSAHAEAWFTLPVARRLRYLRSAMAGTRRVAEAQVRAACAAKGVPFDSPLASEDWFGGPVATLRALRLLAGTLERVAKGGPAAAVPGRPRTRPDGRLVLDTFPADWRDRLLFPGVRAEVWFPTGTTADALARQAAALYGPDPAARGLEPGVAVVLGAGNVASIGPLDVVHKLFAEGQVAVLKFNPVNAYLGPFFEQAFADLVADGYVAAAYGGADVGAYLTSHPGVASVHVTGSRATHDAIVWGAGEEGARRRAAGRPLLDRPITSELGNVTPVVVVPGRWRAADLRLQAAHVATQIAQNAGFNCIAAKAVVLHDAWPQRDAFLAALREALAALPARRAYYPGAAERWARFTAAHEAGGGRFERVAGRGAAEGALPVALLTGLDAADAAHLAFREESFCAVTGVVELPGADAAAFLERAVRFCNDTLDGTLGATVLVDPDAERALGPALDRAVVALRYGTVGVNVWPGLAFALGATPWGAAPGHTLADVGSGVGAVHDYYLLGAAEKSVLRGPFRAAMRPPWYAGSGVGHVAGRAMVWVEGRIGDGPRATDRSARTPPAAPRRRSGPPPRSSAPPPPPARATPR